MLNSALKCAQNVEQGLIYILYNERLTHVVPPSDVVKRWIGFNMAFKVDVRSF